MEENLIDIAKILKSYPSGTKLYSPICGECYLYWVVDEVSVNGVKVDGEIVVYDNNRSKYSFYKDGTQHPMGECLLFPSKNCRDWDAMMVKFVPNKTMIWHGSLEEPKNETEIIIVHDYFSHGFEQAEIVHYSKGRFSTDRGFDDFEWGDWAWKIKKWCYIEDVLKLD